GRSAERLPDGFFKARMRDVSLRCPARQQESQVVVGAFGDARRTEERFQLRDCLRLVGRVGSESKERGEEGRVWLTFRHLQSQALQSVRQQGQVGGLSVPDGELRGLQRARRREKGRFVDVLSALRRGERVQIAVR